jgi:hypothetical protein
MGYSLPVSISRRVLILKPPAGISLLTGPKPVRIFPTAGRAVQAIQQLDNAEQDVVDNVC